MRQPHIVRELLTADDEGQRDLLLILFPSNLNDQMIAELEAIGVSGYSSGPDLVGRGNHGRRLNTAIWPGATGELFTVLPHDQSLELVERLSRLNQRLQAGSRDLYSLHVFSWPCQHLL